MKLLRYAFLIAINKVSPTVFGIYSPAVTSPVEALKFSEASTFSLKSEEFKSPCKLLNNPDNLFLKYPTVTLSFVGDASLKSFTTSSKAW